MKGNLMSDRVDIPSAEELEIDGIEEIFERLIEVVEFEGFEYDLQDGWIVSTLEVEEKVFPFAISLSNDAFVGFRIRLAGEPDVPLSRKYTSAIQKIEKRVYGKVFFDNASRLVLWDYGGTPVASYSLEEILPRMLTEIASSIGMFHFAFTAMDEGLTNAEVSEIVDACIELAACNANPQILH